MVLGDTILQAKLIEQAVLIPLPPSHHRRSPSPKLDQMKESVFAEALKPFFDSIGQERTCPLRAHCEDSINLFLTF